MMKMALFYSDGMPEFKAMKNIYANRVHKFVLDWLSQTNGLSDEDRQEAWMKVSRVKLGNLLKPDTIRPKKYKNKYICFCEIVRPQLKEAHPDMPIKEITEMMGAKWKNFSEDSDPELYEAVNKLWSADQKRYSQEKTLSASLGKEKKSQNSEYIQFCKRLRVENPKITMLELAELWKQRKMSNQAH